jgi:hypothetical protein
MNTWHSLPSDIIKADWPQGPQKDPTLFGTLLFETGFQQIDIV